MPDLADGESTEMKGSGSKPYVLKNVGGVYSCTLPGLGAINRCIRIAAPASICVNAARRRGGRGPYRRRRAGAQSGDGGR